MHIRPLATARNLAKTLSVFGILGALPASAAALTLSGQLSDTAATLRPAFIHDHLAGQAPEPGPYTLRILDSAGELLSAMSFGPSTLFACGPGPCQEIRSHFSLVVPLSSSLRSKMATIQILHGDLPLGTLRSTSWRASTIPGEDQTVSPVAPGREPKAVATGKGMVLFTWDAATHPVVLVKNATGSIIAFAESGSLELTTDSPHLDLLMSDGLRTLPYRISVEGPKEETKDEKGEGVPAEA